MSLHALPVELLDLVAAHLPNPALCALANVDTRCYHVVQRHLYRELYVDDTNLPCVLTLARNPHIARHVRAFTITLSPFNTLLQAFYRLLGRALANMSELTELGVSVDQAASWVMRTPHGSTYHRLRRFASSFHLDHNIAHFLNKTDALLELEVDSLHDSPLPDLPLRADALPRLEHFTGSSKAAQRIVPGRPVGHIQLNAGDLTEEVADSLAQSTAPIQILAAATSSHSVSLINTLTRCMEHLVHLRIVTTYTFSDAPDTVSSTVHRPLFALSHMIS